MWWPLTAALVWREPMASALPKVGRLSNAAYARPPPQILGPGDRSESGTPCPGRQVPPYFANLPSAAQSAGKASVGITLPPTTNSMVRRP